jgi:hypothetical protein
VENLLEPVIEPTPTPSDPEPDPTPTPEPQADPVITTDSVVNILITGTNGDNFISNNIRKFSVALNKIADGRAKVTLFVKQAEEYTETGADGVAVYNTDGRTDGEVESGVWSGEVKYSFLSESVSSYPAKLVMEYEQNDGTTGSEEIDGFDVYSINSWMEYEERGLTFAYPRDLFADEEQPENSINDTSLQCTTGVDPVSYSGPDIYAEDYVFIDYVLEDNPDTFNYEATVQLETVDKSGSTVEMQITNTGTYGE